MSRNDAIIAITSTEARSEGERLIKNGSEIREVALAVMRKAKDGFMAPDENTAFIAAVAAITELYPDKRETILAEAKAIGDRSKVLNAVLSGVPVDFDQVTFAEVPEGALGLVQLWQEANNCTPS